MTPLKNVVGPVPAPTSSSQLAVSRAWRVSRDRTAVVVGSSSPTTGITKVVTKDSMLGRVVSATTIVVTIAGSVVGGGSVVASEDVDDDVPTVVVTVVEAVAAKATAVVVDAESDDSSTSRCPR